VGLMPQSSKAQIHCQPDGASDKTVEISCTEPNGMEDNGVIGREDGTVGVGQSSRLSIRLATKIMVLSCRR
jgi:hypothetical protein